jgi:hypothetical protein
MTISRRKKKPVVLAGSRGIISGGGTRVPKDHLVSSRAGVNPTSWQDRPSHSRPPTGAQHLTMGPHLFPRVHLHSRANKLLLAASNSASAERGDVCGCLGQGRCPSQPSGPIKPTTMCSDLSEPAVASETANRRMFSVSHLSGGSCAKTHSFAAETTRRTTG